MDWRGRGRGGRLHALPDAGGSVGLGDRHPIHPLKPTRGSEPWGAFRGLRAYLGLARFPESEPSHPPALWIPYTITIHLSRAVS